MDYGIIYSLDFVCRCRYYFLLAIVVQMVACKGQADAVLLHSSEFGGRFYGLGFGTRGWSGVATLYQHGNLCCYAHCLHFLGSGSYLSERGRAGGFRRPNVGVLLTLFVLQWLWPEIEDVFGILLGCGYCGGHGTAGAVGEACRKLGLAPHGSQNTRRENPLRVFWW